MLNKNHGIFPSLTVGKINIMVGVVSDKLVEKVGRSDKYVSGRV